MNALLEIHGLHVRIPGLTLVNNIHLSLRAGEFLAIVGESGSGKSMTAMACSGLLPKGITADGAVYFDGHDVLRYSSSAWRRLRRNGVGVIFQDPMSSLNPLMKVSAQIAEAIDGRTALTVAKSVVCKDLLTEVGLSDSDRVMQSYPYELSGGQQQRVMVAMALAGNPRLLIADEPTTALDAATQNQVITLLRSLQKSRRLAILMVTHDLSIVRAVADQLAVFQGGECVEHGPAQQVLRQPRHPYTRMLMGSYSRRLSSHSPRVTHPVREVVTVDGLSFSYPGSATPSLRDISFKVHAGECLGIAGSSGSGKSTLAQMLIGTYPPQRGSVRVADGTPSQRWRSRQMNLEFARTCQYIFQDTTASLNPAHSVATALEEAVKLSGCAVNVEAKVIALLDEVGVSRDLMARRPDDLSGGQRQRVVIARALAMNPAILVCDEPVSALDAHLQKQVIELLMGLQRTRQLTILFIGHDLALMEQFCDRLLVLDQGAVAECGYTEDLLTAPASQATRHLVENSVGFLLEAAA